MNRQSNNFYLDEKERNEKRKCFNSRAFMLCILMKTQTMPSIGSACRLCRLNEHGLLCMAFRLSGVVL